MKKPQILLFLVTLMALAGCGRASRRPQTNDEQEQRTEAETEISVTPTTGPTNPAPTGTTVLVDGQMVAVHTPQPLGFGASGRILSIDVEAGDMVREGDPLAVLDDTTLRQAVTSAELQVSQAETSVAQAQLSLDELLAWQPDEMAIALAEANLAAADAGYQRALSQDEAADNSLTQARINVNQAQRALSDAQEAYDNAWDPGRDWELGVPGRKERLESEREAADRAIQQATESLQIARANYNLTLAGLNENSVVNAEANLASAQQALHQAQTGPGETEITAARLQVTQAELSLQQAEFSLEQARQRLNDALLVAPWDGLVLSVEVAPGAMVGSGTPILRLWDVGRLEFHTSNLSERDLAYVEPGQPAQITLKAYSSQPIDGTVARVVPQASGLVGDAATFTAVIDLDQTELTLMTGMTGRAEILRIADE